MTRHGHDGKVVEDVRHLPCVPPGATGPALRELLLLLHRELLTFSDASPEADRRRAYGRAYQAEAARRRRERRTG